MIAKITAKFMVMVKAIILNIFFTIILMFYNKFFNKLESNILSCIIMTSCQCCTNLSMAQWYKSLHLDSKNSPSHIFSFTSLLVKNFPRFLESNRKRQISEDARLRVYYGCVESPNRTLVLHFWPDSCHDGYHSIMMRSW